ncbi:MAG: hypothetical protein J0H40_14540 [Rhizobiales bacterium]|nr:hypothetical protein [Hyphomicrobiales bacterium]
MNEPVNISVRAAVGSSEQLSVSRAAELLTNSLSAAGNAPVFVSCQFEPSLDALAVRSDEPCVVIASLLPEVANFEQPWADVAARLRKTFHGLTADGDQVAFICTVFRHVPLIDKADTARRIRVRRLNLLAAEISRETGACVIDLDRSLADIGARRLDTDYRLGGSRAAEAVAKFTALAVISAGLDAFVPFEVQDAARKIVADRKIDLKSAGAVAPDMVLPNYLKLGSGRRRQVVATVVGTDKDDYAGWLVQLLLTRQLGIGDAFRKFWKSIARRGFWPSVAMVTVALRQAARGRMHSGNKS